MYPGISCEGIRETHFGNQCTYNMKLFELQLAFLPTDPP